MVRLKCRLCKCVRDTNIVFFSGSSVHISCITRIVPSTFEDDGITPKAYKKEVDAYASIVKDSSKQDALTSAATFKANIEAYTPTLRQDKCISLSGPSKKVK